MKKSRSSFSLLLQGALLIAACVAFLSWLSWDERSDWPVFPSDHQTQGGDSNAGQIPETDHVKVTPPKSPLEPEIVARVERDYGWRIGDLVPVDFYIKQRPGTEVDLHSVALEGDFELAGNPDFVERELADGTKLIRFKAHFQSFRKAPSWRLSANFSYRVLATNDDVTVELPVLQLYTSNTWDGRDLMQKGKLYQHYGMEIWITLAYVVLGALGFVVFRRWRRSILAYIPEPAEHFSRSTRFIAARRRFDRIWAEMEKGDRSKENYIALCRVFRRLYKLETKTSLEAYYWYLYGRNGPIEIASMIEKCEKVIYFDQVLSDEEHYSIKKTFDYLCPPSVVKNEAPQDRDQGR